MITRPGRRDSGQRLISEIWLGFPDHETRL
jgi:hypothetical protein